MGLILKSVSPAAYWHSGNLPKSAPFVWKVNSFGQKILMTCFLPISHFKGHLWERHIETYLGTNGRADGGGPGSVDLRFCRRLASTGGVLETGDLGATNNKKCGFLEVRMTTHGLRAVTYALKRQEQNALKQQSSFSGCLRLGMPSGVFKPHTETIYKIGSVPQKVKGLGNVVWQNSALAHHSGDE